MFLSLGQRTFSLQIFLSHGFPVPLDKLRMRLESIICFHKTGSMRELKAFFLVLFPEPNLISFSTELKLFAQNSLDSTGRTWKT